MSSPEKIAQFEQYIREMTSDRHDDDRPAFDWRDHFIRKLEHDLRNLSPADDERLRRLIRRRTNT